MQLSKQLLILSDFVFLSCMCNQKVMCVSGDFFFFCAMAIALLGVLIIVIFI